MRLFTSLAFLALSISTFATTNTSKVIGLCEMGLDEGIYKYYQTRSSNSHSLKLVIYKTEKNKYITKILHSVQGCFGGGSEPVGETKTTISASPKMIVIRGKEENSYSIKLIRNRDLKEGQKYLTKYYSDELAVEGKEYSGFGTIQYKYEGWELELDGKTPELLPFESKDLHCLISKDL